MNRRSYLKEVGSKSVIIGGLSQSVAAENRTGRSLSTLQSEEEMDNSWEFEDSTTWDGYEGTEWEGSMATSVGYFGSEFIESRDAWYHDFRFVTTAGSECTKYSPTKEGWLDKQSFKLSSSTLEWAETTKDEHFGVWPTGDETSSPIDLNHPAVDLATLAISVINPKVGFTLGAASFIDNLSHVDEQSSDGLELSYDPEECTLWGFDCASAEFPEMGHHKRLFAVDDCESEWLCNSEFTLETGIDVHPMGGEMSVEVDFVVTNGSGGHMYQPQGTVSHPGELSDVQLADLNMAKVTTDSEGSVDSIISGAKTDSMGNVPSLTNDGLSYSKRDMISRFAEENDTVYIADLPIKANTTTD